MIIDCIADLHGNLPKLQGGDLLIVAGDLTARDDLPEYINFFAWLDRQKYRQCVIIAGNHDNALRSKKFPFPSHDRFTYLEDSGTTFEGFKIWGMPWMPWFAGVNPRCKAFMINSQAKLAKKCALIPDGTDILITHGPPFAILDQTVDKRHVGCHELEERVANIVPKLHVFGHIHEAYGIEQIGDTVFVNCSHVDYNYDAVNEPVRIIL